jgi:hypothetical protein
MKNINSITQVDDSSDFLCDVSDLAAAEIAGGLAGAGVEATASASGASSYTGTNARTYAKQLSRHVSIAFGRGSAVAIGNNAAANVNVYGVGDKVIQRTYTRGADDGSEMFSKGFVVAIDYH